VSLSEYDQSHHKREILKVPLNTHAEREREREYFVLQLQAASQFVELTLWTVCFSACFWIRAAFFFYRPITGKVLLC
jgi:hypothetical protein